MLKEHGNKQWMWIFDSRGFSMEHALNIRLARALAQLINNKYSHNLKKIIIVNPTWHINITLKIVLPFLDRRVKNLTIQHSITNFN